jgi:hypothetical protein
VNCLNAQQLPWNSSLQITAPLASANAVQIKHLSAIRSWVSEYSIHDEQADAPACGDDQGKLEYFEYHGFPSNEPS